MTSSVYIKIIEQKVNKYVDIFGLKLHLSSRSICKTVNRSAPHCIRMSSVVAV